MTDINGTMMQYFHWYVPDNGFFWDEVKANAGDLADAGFTALWLPPAYKGLFGGSDVGYGVYDMYDLGEFDQRGSVRTKYGTKKQYLEAIKSLHKTGIQMYADTVLNHRIGADEAEIARATPFNQYDRVHPRGPLREIKSYTRFTFPGRKGKYSTFGWNWHHFDAVDYDEFNKDDHGAVYLFEGKQFDDYTALENGNFAFLMGCDLDFQSKDVRDEVTAWGKWYLDITGADGFRLDAVKHIASWFFPDWLDAMEKHAGKDLFVVGEYWAPDLGTLHWYLDRMGDRMSVFDVPLHYNFHFAGKSGGNYDMRRILDGTLMKERPYQAVTFVENHDSQPLQALETVVEPWFKPLAYSFILLRREGYPCVFYADYYGAEYEDAGRDGNRHKIVMPSHRRLIDIFMKARRECAYGPQYDYFDHWDIIGWTRLGDDSHPKAMAVVMSDGPGGSKWMETGKSKTEFIDVTGHFPETVTTKENGWGEFRCDGGSVSVWVEKDRL